MDIPKLADALLRLPQLQSGHALHVRFRHGHPVPGASVVVLCVAQLQQGDPRITAAPRDIDIALRYLESNGRLFLWRHFDEVGRPPRIVFACRPPDWHQLELLLAPATEDPATEDTPANSSKREQMLAHLTQAWREICDVAENGICYIPLSALLQTKLGVTAGRATYISRKLIAMGIIGPASRGPRPRYHILTSPPRPVTALMYDVHLRITQEAKNPDITDPLAALIWRTLWEKAESYEWPQPDNVSFGRAHSRQPARPLVVRELGLSMPQMRRPMSILKRMGLLEVDASGYIVLRHTV